MRKGILLAGGSGSRLYPLTKSVNKHLLQVYDKPMFYYPLSTLMLADIRDILIITNKKDLNLFQSFFGNGTGLGIHIDYSIQDKPEGVAQSFLIGKDFIKDNSSALIFGDNIFHGNELINQLNNMTNTNSGAIALAYPVSDPERYGVVEFTADGQVIGIEEKPERPKSRYALTGLYFYDNTVLEKALKVERSTRGELEITDINNQYLNKGKLKVELMGRGMAWLDTGTCDSLYDASSYIKTLQQRQGFKIGCPEEIAWRKGWITDSELTALALPLLKSGYGKYLISLIEGTNN